MMPSTAWSLAHSLGLPLSREAEGDWLVAFAFVFPIVAD